MKTFWVSVLFLSTVSNVTSLVRAETTGWSWGPFASSSSKTTISTQTPESKSWMPDLNMSTFTKPVKQATNAVTSATSNAWNTTTKNTKKAWNATTKALDPFPDKSNSSATGLSYSSSTSTKKSSSGWFGSSKSKDEGPKTMQDFFSQKRLQ